MQSIPAVHYANGTHIVFSIATAGTITIASSRFAPPVPSSIDTSRALSTADDFVLSLR